VPLHKAAAFSFRLLFEVREADENAGDDQESSSDVVVEQLSLASDPKNITGTETHYRSYA